jgi:hypothetical protein
MPPAETKKSLTARERQLLTTWIEQGAPYAQHWSFLPPRRQSAPTLRNPSWVRNAIDIFTLARLEQAELSPSPEADRATLLRRVSFDLTGLPPTPEEVASIESDPTPLSYERAVDRLLASPRHAERMALAWLDAARYADTNGFNNDETRTMWPWRDWVIEAFAKNMPYDRFITEQLAGDLLPSPTLDQKIATGFLRNQVHNTEGGIIAEEYRVEYVADRVHTTATVFLGLSLQCARCHDHKYDPITQREYYQFFAFYNSLGERPASYNNFVAAVPFIRVPTTEIREQLTRIERRRNELEKLEAQQKQRPFMDEIMQAAVRAELVSIAKQKEELEKTIPAVMVLEEMPQPRPTHVLVRGDYDKPGEAVSLGVPSVLPPLPASVPRNRLGLAQWLVSAEHPLTARVAVNRWWHMLFGNGIVRTVEDFGVTGEAPTHPEVLDFLATELIRTGWDVRHMLRLMVTSATYRQASRGSAAWQRDPENRLLARGPRGRLPAEMVRDNALAISGLLRGPIGGPSVKPYQPTGLWEDVTVERRHSYVPDKGDGLYRRSMYTFWKRTCPPPTMMNFDAPNREVCVTRRSRTNTPLQALVLMNDPTYVEAARHLANRMARVGGTPEAKLTEGFRHALGRVPTPSEQQVLMLLLVQARERFLKDEKKAKDLLRVGDSIDESAIPPAEHAAWTVVASTILNLDETITKE